MPKKATIEPRSIVFIVAALVGLSAAAMSPTIAYAEDDLITAARTGNVALAKKSVRRGADVNATGPQGRSPLLVAVQKSHSSLVEFLIESGADVDFQEGAPLRSAVSIGDAEISDMLLDAGARRTVTQDKEENPIGMQANWSNPELAQVLSSHGIDINARNNMGDTVAHRQTREMKRKLNHFEMKLTRDTSYDRKNDLQEALRIYRGFFDAGADPNARNSAGTTPLLMLAQTEYVEAARVLLDVGADPSVRDAAGDTALDLASKARQEKMIALLAEGGANPNADPLILFGALKTEDRLRTLLEAGADPNSIGEVCRTRFGLQVECSERNPGTLESRHILHYAISSMFWFVANEDDQKRVEANLGTIRALLEAGSDPDTGAPKNALWLALDANEPNPDLVKLLLEFGATLEGMEPPVYSGADPTYLPHKPYRLNTSYRQAYLSKERENKRKIITAFLESGADPNDANPETAITPLRLAVQRGELGIVRILIDAGADVKGDNVDGEPILLAAIKARRMRLVKSVCSVPSQNCENTKQFVRDQQTIVAELVMAGAPVKSTVGEDIRRLVDRGEALARIVNSDTDYQGVIKEFEKARDAEQLWPPIYYRLGAVHNAAGNFPAALENYATYLALGPDDDRAREVRGKIYELEVMAERYVSARDAYIIMLELSSDNELYDDRWQFSGEYSPRTSFVNFARGDGGTVHNYINGVRNQKKHSSVQIDGSTFHWNMTYYWCDDPQSMPHGCPVRATNECAVVSPRRVVCKGREHADYAEASGEAEDFTWEYNRP